eukprot:756791-Hanusia_phi.AAC.1
MALDDDNWVDLEAQQKILTTLRNADDLLFDGDIFGALATPFHPHSSFSLLLSVMPGLPPRSLTSGRTGQRGSACWGGLHAWVEPDVACRFPHIRVVGFALLRSAVLRSFAWLTGMEARTAGGRRQTRSRRR